MLPRSVANRLSNRTFTASRLHIAFYRSNPGELIRRHGLPRRRRRQGQLAGAAEYAESSDGAERKFCLGRNVELSFGASI